VFWQNNTVQGAKVLIHSSFGWFCNDSSPEVEENFYIIFLYSQDDAYMWKPFYSVAYAMQECILFYKLILKYLFLRLRDEVNWELTNFVVWKFVFATQNLILSVHGHCCTYHQTLAL
jgi:hypothetical protein